MNALLDWMIRGLLSLLETTLSMRLRGKEKYRGIREMESPGAQEFWRGVDPSSRIAIVEVGTSKSSPRRIRRLLFRVETLDLNPSVNVTGTASRPNCKRES